MLIALLKHLDAIIIIAIIIIIMPPPRRVGGIKRWCSSDVWRLSVRRLSRTSGLSREQRGLRRLKLAQR